MHTEINGDFYGYMKRFKMPSGKAFLYPLKPALIAFAIQAIVVAALWLVQAQPIVKVVPVFALMMFAIFFYIKVHYKQFWNVVLEESRGLLPDLMMWIYYIVICIISIVPSFLGLVHYMQ